MATNRYVGPSGANWFDPASWSLGVVPSPGDVADLFGPNGPNSGSGLPEGLTIDLSGVGSAVEYQSGGLILPTFNLSGDQFGTADAPVAIDVTADSGQTSNAFIGIDVLDGSVDVAAGQGAVFAGGGTINGDVDIHTGAGVSFTGSADQELLQIPPPDFTLNGVVAVDGSRLSIYSDDLGGTGSILIENGGTVTLTDHPSGLAPSLTLPIAFGPGGGTLDVSGLEGGYGQQDVYGGVISGFGAGSVIDGGNPLDRVYGGDPLVLTYSPGDLMVSDRLNGASDSFNVVGDLDPASFQLLYNTGDGYSIGYGPTDTYTGPDGGDWFDPANWSRGAVPVAGEEARVYGTDAPNATGGTVPAVTLDISGNSRFVAGTLGSEAAPVAIEITSEDGSTNSPTLSFGTLDGSLRTVAGNSATIEVNGSTALDGAIVAGQGSIAFAGGGSVAIDAAITIGLGSALLFGGSGAVSLDGTIVNGGELAFTNTGDVSGTALADGDVVVANSDANAVTLGVDLTDGRLDVRRNAGGYAGVISNFGADSSILVALPGTSVPATPVYAYSDGTLTISQPGATGPGSVETLHFSGNLTRADFEVSVFSSYVEISYSPCFATGTLIDTPDGAVAVEDLEPGRSVVTLANRGRARVAWIGHRRQVDGEVVRIRRHALGHDVPRRDLVVSVDHGMFLDGVLVQAELLVNGTTIVRERQAEVIFWHVELDRHAILLAEGAPAESYLDTGNRRQFGNCGIAYDPVVDAAVCEPCAEMIFGGARLDAIRLRLGMAEFEVVGD